MVDENFRKDLDELFRLFKRMVEDKSMDEIPGVDNFMLQHFQYFFKNYETMKDQIAEQLHRQFGDSVKDMVKSLVQQLKDELGEDDLLPREEKEEKAIVSIDHVGNDVARIDEMLKNPDLTEEQINELLDRRADLTTP